MSEQLTFVQRILSNWGILLTGWGLITVVFIILGINYAEKFIYLGAVIQNFFQWAGTSFRKGAIEKDLRYRVLTASKAVSKEVDGVMPFDLKIHWVKDSTPEAFVDDNQVIVRLSNKQNKTNTVVYALSKYVEEGLMPETRSYINEKVSKSADMVMTRKLLSLCFEQGICHYDEKYLRPLISADSEIAEYVKQMAKIDEAQFFVQILIKEFIRQSRKIYPHFPDDTLVEESKKFVEFLYKILTKSPGEHENLDFYGNYFKVAIILVAKSDTLREGGTKPYISKALSRLNRGIETIYVIADTKHKVLSANEIAEYIKINDLRVKYLKTFPYHRKMPSDGKMHKGICIEIGTTCDPSIEATG